MARERLSVHKITDVLRLKEAGFSARRIAESLTCARSTVGDTLSRASVAGLTYEDAQVLSDAELYARFYPGNTGSPRRRAEPDYEYLHRELRREGVTLQQLWVLCRCPDYADLGPKGLVGGGARPEEVGIILASV